MNKVDRFMRLFRGYTKRHGQYIVDKQEDSGKWSGRANTVDTPPDQEAFEAHIKGERGIGVIPLTEDNKCYFAAIDIDEYPVDHLKIAWAIRDMPLFVTRSKSNGAHVWLFIPEGARAEIVVRFMKKIAGELGYGGCEIFPKQTRRAGPGDVGNWINLPYFGNSRVGVVVRSEEEKVLDEFLLAKWLDFVEANISGVTEAQLEERAPRVTGTRKKGASKEDYEDGPPCLQRILEKGMGEGSRNNVMYQCVMYLVRKYSSPDEVESRAMKFNHDAYDPPLPASEVRSVIKSVLGKERGFKCHEEPMSGYCDRQTCLRRAFGIGSDPGDLEFEIGGFSKLLSEPPMYAFNADGKRIILPSVKALSNQKEFRNYLIDAISKVMPMMVQGKFDQLLTLWLANCEDVPMPPDADFRVQWADALIDWCESTEHDERDRILKGHSWIDQEGGRVYFQLQYFKKHLSQQRISYNDALLSVYLSEKVGMIFHSKGTTVAGTSKRLYSIPVALLDRDSGD